MRFYFILFNQFFIKRYIKINVSKELEEKEFFYIIVGNEIQYGRGIFRVKYRNWYIFFKFYYWQIFKEVQISDILVIYKEIMQYYDQNWKY